MNIFDSSSGEAKLDYLDADYDILTPGSYVLCAVTGSRIMLGALKYWNVDKQEAYVDAAAAAVGFGLLERKR